MSFKIELDLESASTDSLSDAITLITQALERRADVKPVKRGRGRPRKSEQLEQKPVIETDVDGTPFDPKVHFPGKDLSGRWRLMSPPVETTVQIATVNPVSDAPDPVLDPTPEEEPVDVTQPEEIPSAFRLVMRRVAAAQQKGFITRDQISYILKEIGLKGENIFELDAEPEALCHTFFYYLDELGIPTSEELIDEN